MGKIELQSEDFVSNNHLGSCQQNLFQSLLPSPSEMS
jgi:hypothetical protein